MGLCLKPAIQAQPEDSEVDDGESDETYTGNEIDARNTMEDGERLDYSGSENDDPNYEPHSA